MKKFLTSLCCIAILVAVGAALFACGETANPTFTSSNTITTSVDTSISTLFSRLYNNKTDLGTSTTYTISTLNEKFEQRKTELQNQGNTTLANTKTPLSENDIYCLVGTTSDIEKIESITLGGETFKSTDDFSVSIGNSNFLKDKAFLFKDNKLYIASPIIAFETTKTAKIKINNTEYSIKTTPASQAKEFNQAVVKGSTKGSLCKYENNKFEVSVKDGTTMLCLGFDGLEKTDKAVTKKYINGNFDSYGLTTMESDNGKIGLYMTNYKTNPSEINATKYGNVNWTYKAYILNKNIVATANIHSTLQLDNQ